MTAQLTTRAFTRLFQAFRPGTQKCYSRMFHNFLGFLVTAGLSLQQVDISVILTFMEYLHSQNCKVASISNYMAALRAFFILYDLPTAVFKDHKIQYFIKALKLNRPLVVKNTPIFTEQVLSQIMEVCNYLEHPHVFSALYLLAFFSFLRLSNMVPHSRAQYDHTRHLARGDVIFSAREAIVLIKWSKTIQFRDRVVTIRVPFLPGPSLCPVTALKAMIALVPGSDNDPLFATHTHNSVLPLTDSMVRKHLKRVLALLDLQNDGYTFHTFRRSGASWAYNHGVPMEAIKSQGTWVSDTVWRYIHAQSPASSALLTAFRQHLLL